MPATTDDNDIPAQRIVDSARTNHATHETISVEVPTIEETAKAVKTVSRVVNTVPDAGELTDLKNLSRGANKAASLPGLIDGISEALDPNQSALEKTYHMTTASLGAGAMIADVTHLAASATKLNAALNVVTLPAQAQAFEAAVKKGDAHDIVVDGGALGGSILIGAATAGAVVAGVAASPVLIGVGVAMAAPKMVEGATEIVEKAYTNAKGVVELNSIYNDIDNTVKVDYARYKNLITFASKNYYLTEQFAKPFKDAAGKDDKGNIDLGMSYLDPNTLALNPEKFKQNYKNMLGILTEVKAARKETMDKEKPWIRIFASQEYNMARLDVESVDAAIKELGTLKDRMDTEEKKPKQTREASLPQPENLTQLGKLSSPTFSAPLPASKNRANSLG